MVGIQILDRSPILSQGPRELQEGQQLWDDQGRPGVLLIVYFLVRNISDYFRA